MSTPSLNVDGLFQPLQIGAVRLEHRVVLAPLTRNRATLDAEGAVPTDLAVKYYEQRASKGGLLITEASPVTKEGHGYPQTPGIYTDEQVAGWRKVTDAVHAKGGFIFLQLWHVGRVSHPSFQPNGALPLAPSAIAPKNLTAYVPPAWTPEPVPTPQEMTHEQIREAVAAYAHGARCALAAGFDGVEIHGANGYLIDEFLNDGTNTRTDEYGGSIENRLRFAREVIEAVQAVPGIEGRVGMRVSPWSTFNDISDSDRTGHFTEILRVLQTYNLAYLHVIEDRLNGDYGSPFDASALRELRKRAGYTGPIIAAGGHTVETAANAVGGEDPYAEAVAFGRHFISNPSLPAQIKAGAPLYPYDRNTFYGGGAKGYTDYPEWTEATAEEFAAAVAAAKAAEAAAASA